MAVSTVSPDPQPGAPVAGAELDAGADHRRGRLGRDRGVEQPEHGLGHHQRESVFEALVEPAPEVGSAGPPAGSTTTTTSPPLISTG